MTEHRHEDNREDTEAHVQRPSHDVEQAQHEQDVLGHDANADDDVQGHGGAAGRPDTGPMSVER